MWLQQGLLTYAAIMHSIWPLDYTPHVLLRIMAECKWGEAAGGDRKSQMELVKRFFNDAAKENSGRAVRGEPPLDYPQCRARWAKALESVYPQLAVLSSVKSLSGSGGAANAGGASTGGSNAGGGQKSGRGGGGATEAILGDSGGHRRRLMGSTCATRTTRRAAALEETSRGHSLVRQRVDRYTPTTATGGTRRPASIA
jgi:hypothetical protein